VDHNTDRTDHAIVNFSKIGDFHLNYHRQLPEDGDITQVILKKEKTGEWSVGIVVEYDAGYSEKPAVEDIDPEDTVGIDLGVTKFIHDSENRSFESLDEHHDRERELTVVTVISPEKNTTQTTGRKPGKLLLGHTNAYTTAVRIIGRSSHTNTPLGTTQYFLKILT